MRTVLQLLSRRIRQSFRHPRYSSLRSTKARISYARRLLAEKLEARKVLATAIAWDGGGGDFNWQNAANWDADVIPTAGDAVMISVAPGITIYNASGSIGSLSGNAEVSINSGTLEIAGSSNIDALSIDGGTLSGDGDLTVSGLVHWTSGKMSGSGVLNANGGMLIEGGTQYHPKFLDGRTVNNAGHAIWKEGYLIAYNGAVFNNLATGTFEIQSGYDLIYGFNNYTGWEGQGALATFNNAGTLIKTGDTAPTPFEFGPGTMLDLNFHNTGTVIDNVSTLQFQHLGAEQGFVTTGDFEGAAGTNIILKHATLDPTVDILGDGVTLANGTMAGTYRASGISRFENVEFTGTPTLIVDLEVDGVVNLSTGSPINVQSVDLGNGANTGSGDVLTGTSDLTVSGLFHWTAGKITGNGVLNANGGILIEGGTQQRPKFLDGRTVNNAGHAIWKEGYLIAYNGAVFNNLATGTFEIQSGYDLLYGFINTGWGGQGALATFNNAGTFIKTGDTAPTPFEFGPGTMLDLHFLNSGSVNANSYRLSMHSYLQTAGETYLNGGMLVAPRVAIQAGSMTGSGALSNALENRGTLVPGDTTGLIAISGDFFQVASGELNIDIGGATPGSQFDQLTASGVVNLSGELNLSLINSFVPVANQAFTIIRNDGSSPVVGAFNGLFEGSVLHVGDSRFLLSYAGGDGNDVTLTNLNAPPTANAGGPYKVVRGGMVTLDGGGSSDLNQPSNTLLYSWDLDGDGLFGETGSAAVRGEEVGITPTFSAVGLNSAAVPTISLQVTNAAGLSSTSTSTVTVSLTGLLDDPLKPGEKMLVIGGSTGDDTIRIRVEDDHHDCDDQEAQYVTIRINEHDEMRHKIRGTLALPVSRIVVYAQAGDDDVKMDDNSTIPAWLFGGDGDDRIKGGAGNDVILGGAGCDLLAGDGGRDLLIGGIDADRIIGNVGDDILIAGTTDFDGSDLALSMIMKEWTRTDSTLPIASID